MDTWGSHQGSAHSIHQGVTAGLIPPRRCRAADRRGGGYGLSDAIPAGGPRGGPAGIRTYVNPPAGGPSGGPAGGTGTAVHIPRIPPAPRLPSPRSAGGGSLRPLHRIFRRSIVSLLIVRRFGDHSPKWLSGRRLSAMCSLANSMVSGGTEGGAGGLSHAKASCPVNTAAHENDPCS